MRWIREEVAADAPVLVGGDFNDWQNRLSDRFCDELGLIEAFDALKPRFRRMNQAVRYMTDRLTEIGWVEGSSARWQLPRRVRSARTYPSLVPWLRMDRLYLRGFEVRQADVLRGPGWARLSDHSPLVVDLKLLAVADCVA